MIVQLHITDAEIKTFFEDMGYDCDYIAVPEYRQVTHGRGEVTDSKVLHVCNFGVQVQASRLMNEYIKLSILKPLSSPGANVAIAIRSLSRG